MISDDDDIIEVKELMDDDALASMMPSYDSIDEMISSSEDELDNDCSDNLLDNAENINISDEEIIEDNEIEDDDSLASTLPWVDSIDELLEFEEGDCDNLSDNEDNISDNAIIEDNDDDSLASTVPWENLNSEDERGYFDTNMSGDLSNNEETEVCCICLDALTIAVCWALPCCHQESLQNKIKNETVQRRPDFNQLKLPLEQFSQRLFILYQ